VKIIGHLRCPSNCDTVRQQRVRAPHPSHYWSLRLGIKMHHLMYCVNPRIGSSRGNDPETAARDF